METKWGREVLSRRRKKGRRTLTVKLPALPHTMYQSSFGARYNSPLTLGVSVSDEPTRHGVPDAPIRPTSAILGAPTSDTGWVATASLAPLQCRGTQARFVVFHDLQLFFSDESGYAKDRLHFAAFKYGPATGDHIDPYGLATDAGMKVGATVAEMKKAYPKLGLNQPSQAHPYPGFSIRHGLTGILTGLLDTDTVTGFIGGSACTS